MLTNCDVFENLPASGVLRSQAGWRTRHRVIAGLALLLRARPLRHAVMRAAPAAPLTIRPLPEELLSAWFAPLRDPRIRADVRAVWRGISPKRTMAAAERLTVSTVPR